MGFFEFLIQREGDRSWLPIESSEVEILEGRYRIMGRSPQLHHPIDIRISYLDLEAIPPRRRTHKRTSQTNAQGLVAVMPFTVLRNGKWGIQCSAENVSEDDSSEEGQRGTWQRKIQLQVLEDTAHHADDFEPEYASVEDPEDIVNELSADPEREHHELQSIPLAAPAPASEEQSLAPSLSEELFITSSSSLDAPLTDSSMDDSPVSAVNSASAEPAPIDQQPVQQASQPDLVNELEQMLEQLEQLPIEAADSSQDLNILSEQSSFEDAPVEEQKSSTRAELPKDLPIDLESLSPDIRDDIANVFQTVDSIAEEILASIGQRLNTTASTPVDPPVDAQNLQDSVTPNRHAQESSNGLSSSADPLEALEFLAPEDADDDSLFTMPDEDVVMATGSAASSPEQSIDVPTLQLRLDYDAWTLQGDRHLILSGAIHATDALDSLSAAWQRPLTPTLTVRLTDPQTGAILNETAQPIPLTQDAPTPFSLSIVDIPPTQAHVVLGEASLAIQHQQDAPLLLSTQTFVVTVELDSLLGAVNSSRHDSTPTPQQVNSLPQSHVQPELPDLSHPAPPLSFVEPDDDSAGTQASSTDPRPFRVSDQSTLPPKLQPDSAAEPDSPSEARPPIDLPDFVKSPTSLASSILGLAGLSSDSFTASSASTDQTPPPSSPVENGTDDISTDISTERENQEESPDSNSVSDDATSNAASDDSAPPEPDPNDWLQTLMQEAEHTENSELLAAANEHHEPEAEHTGDSTFQDTIDNLEHAAQFTDSQLTDPELVDPFDLLDESDGDFNPTPSAAASFNVSGNLAQQYIPDYSDEPASRESDDVSVPEPWNNPDDVLADAVSNDDLGDDPSTVSPEPFIHTQEIVVDDDPWNETPQDDVAIAQSSAPIASSPDMNSTTIDDPFGEAVSQQPELLTQYSVLPDDMDVPIPTIECLDDELVAGQAFYITVTLPNLGPRIFVKLWIQDRQTRTLLDGPRWLADFVNLDDSHLMQTRTQLTIPLGALDVRVEAIAMEMMTQRESHKASLDKLVIHPDMPTFSLDELT